MALFKPPKPRLRTIHCPHCGLAQDVSITAQSVVCHVCNRSMQIADHKITHYSATTQLETCGAISVEKKASVIVQKRVVAESLSLRGSLKGDAVVFEGARISSGGYLKGNLKARTLVVEEGAVIQGYLEIGAAPSMPGKS